MLPVVDAQAVNQIISEWTRIPLGRMARDEIASVLNLSDEIDKRVMGQKHGLELIANRITTSRANLADPNRPIAVIMPAGPSGVGKTETALALGEQLYGSENNIVTINMSEFQRIEYCVELVDLEKHGRVQEHRVLQTLAVRT